MRHEDGSGTRFYDSTRYAVPKGDYQLLADANGGRWYAVQGKPAVERKPVYENGKPVYDGRSVKTMAVETARYQNAPAKFREPVKRKAIEIRPPRRKK